jgi:hypothetical protein
MHYISINFMHYNNALYINNFVHYNNALYINDFVHYNNAYILSKYYAYNENAVHYLYNMNMLCIIFTT